MKRTATLVLVVVSLAALAGCTDSPEFDQVAPSPPPVPTSAVPTPVTSSAVATPVTSSAVPTATPTPVAAPTPAPTTPTSQAPSPALTSVRKDVEQVAPALESFYRDREYPVDLAQVLSTLPEADVSLASGNRVAGYLYDGDAVEFQLCIESESGAFATYDTAPMTLRRSGASGGCPSS